MIILSHRGYWLTESEKNTVTAFKKSFELGFGTETDIRDLNGRLVISHDMPVENEANITVADFFELYKSYHSDLPIALNIKADGLQKELMNLLKQYNVFNYFVFDMSVPDGLLYLNQGFNAFTRQSEYETIPSFYPEATGIWLDEFKGHWIDENTIKHHTDNQKKICIVSPELHKRTHELEWANYKKIAQTLDSEIMICSDVPEKARAYFNEN